MERELAFEKGELLLRFLEPAFAEHADSAADGLVYVGGGKGLADGYNGNGFRISSAGSCRPVDIRSDEAVVFADSHVCACSRFSRFFTVLMMKALPSMIFLVRTVGKIEARRACVVFMPVLYSDLRYFGRRK